MRTVFVPVALAAALLALAAPGARAEWVEGQLTPQDVKNFDRSFQITTRDIDGLKEFVVTVAPKSGKLSPFTDGDLSVIAGDSHIAEVPVAATWNAGAVTYRFRIAPQSMTYSRFEVREQAYGTASDERGNPEKDAQGKPKVERSLGGRAYWFYLGDFAGGETR